jgi:hypothetical protein
VNPLTVPDLELAPSAKVIAPPLGSVAARVAFNATFSFVENVVVLRTGSGEPPPPPPPQDDRQHKTVAAVAA